MGSFFLTSKKASATLVFLVISILVVSSGVIITNQIKKSNDDNVAETGLVLLDTEQDTSQYADSSGDEIKFTFGDSEGRISSKKSSGGGGGGASSASEIDEDFVNDSNSSRLGDLEDNSFENSVNDSNFVDNETEVEDDFIDLSNEIFSKNGTNYIMRDGEEYVLSISSSTYYINFDPPLPSSVCENEKIDITVRGKAEVKDPSCCGALIRIRIMEEDYLVGDDTVAAYASWYSSADCKNVYFRHTFEDVDLSDWIIPDPGGNGEFYAKASSYPNIGCCIVNDLSTVSYDVYAYRNGEPDECKCLSGPCCDLRSRPYKFKPYPSQPTGYTDFYGCWDPNSPIGTSSVYKVNYYCNGISSSASDTTSIVDTCGICEYCTLGDSTCNYYGTSSVCGTKDCDYLDTTCRDYDDVAKYCNGGGSCSISGTCNDYTNEPKHTYCGTNKECDGSGTCIACTSHEYYSCSDNDVYWYDACDNREEKKTECGESYVTDWSYYCDGDDRWKKRTYVNKWCDYGVCHTEQHDASVFVETCQYGCENGQCQPNPIECTQDSDCPSDYYMGDAFCCFEGHVCKLYRDYFCAQNPEHSYCTYIEQNKIIEPCGTDYCENWGNNYCESDDVYHNKTCHDKGCSDAACFDKIYTEEEKVQECGEWGCSDGECLYVECYNDTECGPDDDYVGDPFCQDDNVWQNYINYTCNYPGTGNSYCSNSTAPDLKEPCGTDYCENWESNYCKLDDVYHERTCHDKGCSSGVCFDNTYTEEEKVQECGTSEYIGTSYCYNNDVYRDYITRTCSNSRCISPTSEKKVEDCAYGCTSGRCKIEVCSYGMCYYV